MATQDNGPATNSAVLTFNNQASVEVHIGNPPSVPGGILSFEPIDAPIQPVRVSTTQAASPKNNAIFVGGRMQIPA